MSDYKIKELFSNPIGENNIGLMFRVFNLNHYRPQYFSYYASHGIDIDAYYQDEFKTKSLATPKTQLKEKIMGKQNCKSIEKVSTSILLWMLRCDHSDRKHAMIEILSRIDDLCNNFSLPDKKRYVTSKNKMKNPVKRAENRENILSDNSKMAYRQLKESHKLDIHLIDTIDNKPNISNNSNKGVQEHLLKQ